MNNFNNHHHTRANGTGNTSAPLSSHSSRRHDTAAASSDRPDPKPVQASGHGQTGSSSSSSSSSSSTSSASSSGPGGKGNSTNVPHHTDARSIGHSLLRSANSASASPQSLHSSRSGGSPPPPGLSQTDDQCPLYAVVCSRCHQEPDESPFAPSRDEMVSFGTNLYYCCRCAKTVGYLR